MFGAGFLVLDSWCWVRGKRDRHFLYIAGLSVLLVGFGRKDWEVWEDGIIEGRKEDAGNEDIVGSYEVCELRRL